MRLYKYPYSSWSNAIYPLSFERTNKKKLADPAKQLSVSVRILLWQGTPHEWALDNVGWQGSTIEKQ